MGQGEVEGMEGVGGVFSGLIRLWKCVEMPQRRSFLRGAPTLQATQRFLVLVQIFHIVSVLENVP